MFCVSNEKNVLRNIFHDKLENAACDNKCESHFLYLFIYLFVYVYASIICLTAFIMAPPPICSNPFGKKGHSNCRKNLVYFSKNRDASFQKLFDLYVCRACNRQLYRNTKSVRLENINFTTKKVSENVTIEQECDDEEKEEESEDETKNILLEKDKEYVCNFDNKNKRLRLAIQ